MYNQRRQQGLRQMPPQVLSCCRSGGLGGEGSLLAEARAPNSFSPGSSHPLLLALFCLLLKLPAEGNQFRFSPG